MQCPYCIGEISDQALACPHCTRDLYLIKPLLEKIGILEQRVQELEALTASTVPAETTEVAELIPPLPPPPFGTRTDWLLFWLPPLLLLLAAHALITVVIDLNTLYLRLVSLVIPLPFALLLMQRDQRFPFWTGAGFGMAILAVLGMSSLIGMIDHTSIWPQDGREWREFASYAASIGFSYMTGLILGRMLRQRREVLTLEAARGLTGKVVSLLSTGKQRADQLQATMKKVQEVRGTLTALSTAALSAYTGLQSFFGHNG